MKFVSVGLVLVAVTLNVAQARPGGHGGRPGGHGGRPGGNGTDSGCRGEIMDLCAEGCAPEEPVEDRILMGGKHGGRRPHLNRTCVFECVTDNADELGDCATEFFDKVEEMQKCQETITELCGENECKDLEDVDEMKECMDEFRDCIDENEEAISEVCPKRKGPGGRGKGPGGRELRRGGGPGGKGPGGRPRPDGNATDSDSECKTLISETCSECAKDPEEEPVEDTPARLLRRGKGKRRPKVDMACLAECVEQNTETLGECGTEFLEKLAQREQCKETITGLCGDCSEAEDKRACKKEMKQCIEDNADSIPEECSRGGKNL